MLSTKLFLCQTSERGQPALRSRKEKFFVAAASLAAAELTPLPRRISISFRRERKVIRERIAPVCLHPN